MEKGRLEAFSDGVIAIITAIGADSKGWFSLLLYVIGIALTFWKPMLGSLVYALVAVMWLIPDKRVEKAVHHSSGI